jgi:hypothetical protein
MIIGKIVMKVKGLFFGFDEKKGTFRLNKGKLTVNVDSDGKSNEGDIDLKAVEIVPKNKKSKSNEVKLHSTTSTLGWKTLNLTLETPLAADECRRILLEYKNNPTFQTFKDNINSKKHSGKDPNPLSVEGQL